MQRSSCVRVSAQVMRPMPSDRLRWVGDPPETKTAAPTGIGSGGEKMEKLGAIPAEKSTGPTTTLQQVPRIIATHYGLEAGEAWL